MLFVVFGVTGSSSLLVVRPMLKKVGFEGSMKEGPWSYRIGSILLVSPAYACILLTLGTLAGRHAYFAGMAQKMLQRFVPRKVGSKIACPRSGKVGASAAEATPPSATPK